MKKCPFCAEEIQDEATVCKFCKSSITSRSTVFAKTKGNVVNYKLWAQIVGVFILVLVAIKFWYVVIPALIIWVLFKEKKLKLSHKNKIIVSASIIIVFAILGFAFEYTHRVPSLKITEPQDQASIQSGSTSIKGSVSPKSSIVFINKVSVPVSKDGNFIFEATLNNENNTFAVAAFNGGKDNSQTLNIKRIFTPEEIAEREAKKQAALQAQKKAQADAEAKAKAEQAAYDKTKAGQICKKHPDWSRDDCQGIADNKIWIGMSIDMLKAERGLPSSANPSNYGSGDSWQWCWFNHTPSCFYGESDGIVTSYN